jgi:hypothetical protein
VFAFEPRYGIGVYRFEGMTDEIALRIAIAGLAEIGAAYGWSTAIWLGFKKVLRMRHADPKTPSPNDMIAWSTNLRLVFLI